MPFPIFRLGDQPEVVRDHTRGDKRTHFGHLADRPVRRTVSLLLYDLMAWASRIRGLWAEGLGSFEIDHQLLPDWLPRRRLRGWTADVRDAGSSFLIAFTFCHLALRRDTGQRQAT